MSLKDLLLQRISNDGPIPLADYMQTCLLHPERGYYATRDPLGAAGDFTTAPEISQMFGELLGLCLAQSWMDQGGGDCALVELGPGRGTLMADMLRAMGKVPGLTPEVHLVEASPALRDVQAQTLKGVDITWHETVESLPKSRLFGIANEFFDALPIRQFVREGQGWAERVIGRHEDQLTLSLDAPRPVGELAHRLADTGNGDVVELSPALPQIVSALSNRIAEHGGAAVIVDYGDWESLGDTFQAVRNHKPCDPLDSPGLADLTAHVDFKAIRDAALCAVSKMTTQGALLEQLGIGPRAQALAERLDNAGDTTALESHLAAYRRLTDPDQMGNLFKAIALYPHVTAPPPGFAP